VIGASRVGIGELPGITVVGTGGGDVFFDDVLICHDGLFVPEDQLPLKPEKLKKLR
jgi:hypothetical protein